MAPSSSTTDFAQRPAGGDTCYRHKGRQTGVSCSSCGRPICPDCMTPSPVGMRCPECASDRQRVIPARAIANPGLLDVAPVTVALMVVNVLAFIAEVATGGGLSGLSSNISGSVLREGVFFGPAVADGQWWRVVTSGFLHLGLFHIGMNMLLLYLLGQLLEPAIGGVRFAAIYFASLVAGSLGSLLIEPTIAAAGASGAVFGLMGAALVASRSRGINPWESGIGGLIVINLLITFAVPGIAKGGHVGGLVGGLIVGYILIEFDDRRRLFGRSVAPAIVIGTIVTAALFYATIAVAENKFAAIAAFG
ncbi:MAG: rhomboid family intramembrane serine protease [Solirubrobacterales bacterium]